MINFLKEFQTLVVGLIGFSGVIITMIVNSRIQRDLQKTQRDHESKSLRVALLTELKENVRVYEDRIKQISEPNENLHVLIQNSTVNKIYQTFLPKLGLLSIEEAESVHRAYLLLEEMPYRLRILVGMNFIGGLNNEFIRIDESRQKIAGEIHRALLPSIRNAVNVLDKKFLKGVNQ